MNDELRRALDDLRFSDDEKARLARNLAAACEEPERSEERAFAASAQPGGKRTRRTIVAIAAAACLTAAICGGAYASGALSSMEDVFDDVFGGPPAQTEVIDRIGHPLGVSATASGVTITAEAIVGDARSYALVFRVEKDDGTAFEGIEPLENGLLPLWFENGSMLHVPGFTGSGGSSSFHDPDPADNALRFVQRMAVSTSDGTIVGKTAHVELSDLCTLDSEGGRRMVAEGTWKMKFAIDYEDTSVALPAGQALDVGGMDATVEVISLSPLSLAVDYTVQGTIEQDGSAFEQDPAARSKELDRFRDVKMTVHLKDGTSIDASNAAGSMREQGSATACSKTFMFDTFLNLDEVASVTVGEVEVAFP